MNFLTETTTRTPQRPRFGVASFGSCCMLMSANYRGIQHQNLDIGIFQQFHDLREHAVFAPAIESLKHTVPGAEPFRQITPRSAGLGDPKDGVDELTIALGSRA